MNVQEALMTRKSVRAFRSDPVTQEKLERILTAVARTPSWGNTQPWETFVALGEAMNRIRAGFAERMANAVLVNPEMPHPKGWSEAAKNRTLALHPQMREVCDEKAVSEFGVLNQSLFRAPAGIWLCMDKKHGEWSMFDIGAYSQSIILASWEEGLSTIPAYSMVPYPDVLREVLAIPEHLRIVIGIAIGYADDSHAINRFVSDRCPLIENVRFVSK